MELGKPIWKSNGQRSTWNVYLWEEESIRLQNVIKYREEGTLVFDSVFKVVDGKIKGQKIGTRKTVAVPNYIKKILELHFFSKADITKIKVEHVRTSNPLPSAAKDIIQELMREIERNTVELWELTSDSENPPPTAEELIVSGEMSQAYYKASDLLNRPRHEEDLNGINI